MLLLSPLISANLPIRMSLNSLRDIPHFLLPDGYSFRSYLPGDRHTWTRLQRVANPDCEITDETFVTEFGRHQPALIARQFYAIAPDGAPAGTATAWAEGAGKTCGLVKWLSVTAAYCGRGLEEALLSEACRRLQNLGHVRASAQIGSAQLDLVRLLERSGFRPEMAAERDRAIWEEINRYLEDLQHAPALLRLVERVKRAWAGRAAARKATRAPG